MNLVPSNQSLTMSSREIAELVEKRHDNVKRTIEALIEKAVISHPQIEDGQKSANGVVEKLFMLNKRDSLIVVAQLCPEFTAKIVDRWQELEAQIQAPALNPANLSRLQLIQIALESEQERLALEHKVEELAPKAEALDRLTLADGEVCLQTAGKLLQQPPNKFIAWLRSLGTWIFKRQGSSRNSAYTDKINAGYLNVRTVTTILPDGSERVTEQVVVTPKGLAKCHDLHFHDLRHEATSRFFERTGLSDVQISRITGHRDPRMLRRYSNLRASDLAELLW